MVKKRSLVPESSERKKPRDDSKHIRGDNNLCSHLLLRAQHHLRITTYTLQHSSRFFKMAEQGKYYEMYRNARYAQSTFV